MVLENILKFWVPHRKYGFAAQLSYNEAHKITSLYTHLPISFLVPASWVFPACQGSPDIWGEPPVGKRSRQTNNKQNKNVDRHQKKENFQNYKSTDKNICWNHKRTKFYMKMSNQRTNKIIVENLKYDCGNKISKKSEW